MKPARDDPSNSKANSRNVASDIVGSDNKDFTNLMLTFKVFNFPDLERATRSFSQKLFIHTEGYGETFLGWVDKKTFSPSTVGRGIAVAVERCNDLREWQEVVPVLGRLAHPNIISLLGYCDDRKDNEGWFLVYDYMQNQNLGHFLFGSNILNPCKETIDAGDAAEPLSWRTRLTIMIGVARGLSYIHSLKDQVIHRSVKSSNILLDQDFNAKLGGWELARFGPEVGETHAFTGVMVTYNYADPVYVNTGDLSGKRGIYGFGVVLLETLTGRQVTGSRIQRLSLVELASSSLASRSELKKILDPRLKQNYPLDGAFQCAALILRCVSLFENDRPSSEEVLQNLEQIYAINI